MGAAAFPAPAPVVELSTAAVEPMFGDSLSVRCLIHVPDGIVCGQPSLPDDSSGEYVVRGRSESADTGEGAVVYDILAWAFAPDSLRIGPMRIPWTSTAGDSGVAVSNVIILPVGGQLDQASAAKAAPRPSRTPIAVRSRGISLFGLLLVALALVIAAFMVRYIRRTDQNVSEQAVDETPMDELGEFERIRALRLHERGRIRELYILVSDALRGFIHRNMNGRATYETTSEIMDDLTSTSVREEVITAFEGLFCEADMVKFARFMPLPETSASIIDRALEPLRTVLDDIEREKTRIAAEAARESSREAEPAAVLPGRGGAG